MLAFSNDYYGFIFRATQSVELFCAYIINFDMKKSFIQIKSNECSTERKKKDEEKKFVNFRIGRMFKCDFSCDSFSRVKFAK